MSFHPVCVLLGALLAAIPVAPTAPLLENDQVKVMRALEKNETPGKFHQHDRNRVMIYLQPGRQQFAYQDGRPKQTFDWKAGQVVWSQPDGMHSPNIIGPSFNIIEIELKKPASSEAPAKLALDPLTVDPRHYKLDFENSQVRVLRVKIGPHESARMHAHSINRVTVFLTDQHFKTTDAEGKVSMVDHKAGDVAWGTPLKHTEQNLSDQPFEAVTVEIK